LPSSRGRTSSGWNSCCLRCTPAPATRPWCGRWRYITRQRLWERCLLELVLNRRATPCWRWGN